MEIKTKIFLFTLIAGILIYLDTLQTEIYSLYLHNIDEFAFHDSLLRILSGIKNLDIRIFFGTGYFNYGFLYFFGVFVFVFHNTHMNEPSLIMNGVQTIFIWTLKRIVRGGKES